MLWPLFVAACEARSDRDRGLARYVFKAVEARQGMTNIERAWAIVLEVWRRCDRLEDGEEEELALWRTVAREMGFQIVFG
jgi:hypothetical protein